MKILISATPFAQFNSSPLEKLKQAGHEVVISPYGCYATPAQSIELLSDIDGIVAGIEPLNHEVLKSAKKLKIISRVGIGLDSIDLDTAEELGIQICNTPDAPTDAVAELTVGFILSLLRQIPLSDSQMKKGEWSPLPGRLLRGKKVGVIGLGRIGRQVCPVIEAFWLRLISYGYPASLGFYKTKWARVS